MKVTESIASEKATSSKIDLELDLLPPKARDEVKETVGQFLIEQTLLAVGDAKSPVAGEAFPALSKDYRKWKQENGGVGKPNLEFEGDLLSALDFKKTKDGIEIGVFGSQAPKADGHNNFSGESRLPQRRFLPDVGQEFKPGIQREVERIIADAVAENAILDREALASIGTASELYAFLEEAFSGMSRARIRDAILNSPELFDLLESEGLTGLL